MVRLSKSAVCSSSGAWLAEAIVLLAVFLTSACSPTPTGTDSHQELAGALPKKELQVTGAQIKALFPSGPGDIYGLRAGDVLFGWEQRSVGNASPQSEESGAIRSPLDARIVEDERAPQGGLHLRVFRDGKQLLVPVSSGRWEVDFRAFVPVSPEANTPNTSAPETRTPEVELGVTDLAAGDPRDSAPAWTTLESEALRRDALPTARWHRIQAARSHLFSGQHQAAQEAFEAARSSYGASRTFLAPSPSDPPAFSEGSTEAAIYAIEGLAWQKVGDLSQAETALHQSLEIHRQQAPGSVAVATALVRLAEAIHPRLRKPLLLEAREIYAQLAPEGADLAHVLNLLGIFAGTIHRDYDEAIELYRQALRIRQQTIPGSYRVSDTLSNLSSCAHTQGRLDDAEELIKASLDGHRDDPRLVPRSAGALNSLALIQRDKGNYRGARQAWEKALELFSSLDPDSPAVAGTLNNLGNLALRVKNLDRAKDLYSQSLASRRKLQPASLAVAHSLNNLSIVAKKQGRLGEARRYLEESLELKEQFAPGSLTLANTLGELGSIRMEEGLAQEAESFFRQALALRLKIAPQAPATAQNLIRLARCLAWSGREAEAIEIWRSALDQLDRTGTRFRFSPFEQSIFASQFQEHYRDLALLLDRREQTIESFELLERSRARSLRTMTSQHRRENQRNGEHPTAPSGLESPVLSWTEARAALDEGTRLIFFSVTENETSISVAGDLSLQEEAPFTYRVAVARETLRRKVEIFRALIARGQQSPLLEKALVNQGQSLYDLLLAPLADRLEPAQRLLIVPDRPLSMLPFAALVRSRSPIRFVGEWKPLSYSASATTFALAKDRRKGPSTEALLTIFARSGNGVTIESQENQLAPLPGAKAEARLLADLFGPNSEVYLDSAASEAAAKRRFAPEVSALTQQTPNRKSYLHFATHGLLDDRAPLRSALLLESGQGEEGRLQALEVMEEMRFDSELVTLSACETGLGQDLAGEGILGLTYAFLSSGARSALTSLWKVSDASTVSWMETFYRSVQEGTAKDRAVMEAQIRLMAPGSATRHPYYWAGFQLWGDGAN
ncbi:MAG: CHAT domain-containing protein [Deltaproteobacteria bacterium]|nr:CHAT domain-containing protein [Deltaproteobacteria bacterium]